MGVTFDQWLPWSVHVVSLVASASRPLFALRTLRPHFSDNDLKTIYFSSIRSIFEYCSPVFLALSKTDSHRIERIQDRVHRMLCGRGCQKQCFPTLASRRRMCALEVLDKIMKPHHLLNNILPPMSRSVRCLLPKRHFVRRSNSFILKACKMYNESFKR